MIRQLLDQATALYKAEEAARVERYDVEDQIAAELGVKKARRLMKNTVTIGERLEGMTGRVIKKEDGSEVLYCTKMVDDVEVLYLEDL